MMQTLSLAWRNTSRNRRRSAITVMTIALGAAALLLLGGLMSYIVLEFETSTVRRGGHLAVMQRGFFEYGSGNPAGYGIADYGRVLKLIGERSELAGRVRVATPSQQINGVIGNYAVGASKTFFGQGVVPADRLRMREWNDYGIEDLVAAPAALARPDGVAIGSGVARILQVCLTGAEASCARGRPVPAAAQDGVRPAAPATPPAASAAPDVEDTALAALRLRERSVPAAEGDRGAAPRLELLAATATGAPNVLQVAVERIDRLGARELDDNLVVMPLAAAQSLIYGRGEPRVTALNLQLKTTADVAPARAALQALFTEQGLPLEVRDFTEINSLYRQTQAFFGFLFAFVALVIGVVVLFTTLNTMGMTVMERFGEIGTARALGAQRREIAALFISEGALQGALGATLGIVLAALVVMVVNSLGLSWNPPTSAGAVPFRLYLFGRPDLMVGTWVALVGVAALAAFWPARRAARLEIVDALRQR